MTGFDFSSAVVFGFAGLGMMEMIIIGMIAVLLFGKKLPEVAKQLGGSYREFRKGLSEIQSQMDVNSYASPDSYSSPAPSYDDYDDYEEAAAPKFEPPPAEPAPSKDDSLPSGDIDKPIDEK